MSNAVFSPCLKYRYILRRQLSEDPRTCLFIMLNPSTADETKNDPTVRRCIGYAKKWGFGKLIVCNLFALRSTDPKKLFQVKDPMGPENTDYIRQAIVETAKTGGIVVCAWGAHGEHWGAGKYIIKVVRDMGAIPYCLQMTKSNQPSHPLYLKSDLVLKVIPKPVWG